jgi:putative NADPH-quinone reductase
MKILIITAHPSSLSHTKRIAETYANAKREKNDDVQTVDLYAPENQLPLLSFENIRERPIDKVQKKFQEQLVWADEIVVIHPIWWGTPPAIMKNWAEQAFWPGVAYKYTPEGKVNKLLAGRTAKVFVTSGGIGWIYRWFFMSLSPFWKLSIFGFTGVDVVEIQSCGYLDKYRGEKAEKIFTKFLTKITASAL